MSCFLHRVLLGASGDLQHLRVTTESEMSSDSAKPQQISKPDRAAELQTAAISAARTLWALDTPAPSLKSLVYVLPDAYSRSSYEYRPLEKEATYSREQLAGLAHLGFQGFSADTVSHLEAWLSLVSNLKRLYIEMNRQPPPDPYWERPIQINEDRTSLHMRSASSP